MLIEDTKQVPAHSNFCRASFSEISKHSVRSNKNSSQFCFFIVFHVCTPCAIYMYRIEQPLVYYLKHVILYLIFIFSLCTSSLPYILSGECLRLVAKFVLRVELSFQVRKGIISYTKICNYCMMLERGSSRQHLGIACFWRNFDLLAYFP